MNIPLEFAPNCFWFVYLFFQCSALTLTPSLSALTPPSPPLPTRFTSFSVQSFLFNTPHPFTGASQLPIRRYAMVGFWEIVSKRKWHLSSCSPFVSMLEKCPTRRSRLYSEPPVSEATSTSTQRIHGRPSNLQLLLHLRRDVTATRRCPSTEGCGLIFLYLIRETTECWLSTKEQHKVRIM